MNVKRFLSMVYVFILSCLCFTFIGCNKVENTYKLYSVSYLENGIKVETTLDENLDISFTITLNENSDAIFIYTKEENSSEVYVGTWSKIDQESIVITVENEGLLFKYDGTMLTLNYDQYTIIFKKINSLIS